MLRAAQEQLLWSMKNKVLEDNMDLLSRNLEPRRHYGYLRSAAVLNSEDQETIDNQTTKRQRAIAMVDILRTKGPRAFDALCGSLEQDKTQMFLLSALNKALEREIDERRAMLTMNNLPAQHVIADDLPLPELPSVIGTTTDSDSYRTKGSSNDLPLQYSIEEEDGGNSQKTSESTTLTSGSGGSENSCQFDNSEC